MSTTAAELVPDPDADGLVGGSLIWHSDVLPPNGKWRFHDGATLSRTTYSLLFSRIGTTHGTGDGSTTFTLPNDTDQFYRGSGTVAPGATGGSATGAVTLSGSVSGTTGSEGSHTHTGGGTTATYNGTGYTGINGGGGADATGLDHTHNYGFTTSAGSAHSHAFAGDASGVTGTADTIPPYTAVRHIIKVL